VTRDRVRRPILVVVVVVVIVLAGSAAAVAYAWPRGQNSAQSGTNLANASHFFRCGESLDLSTARRSNAGVTVAVSEVREQSPTAPPAVYATYSANDSTPVLTTPPENVALYALRGNVVVAGTTLSPATGEPLMLGDDQIGYVLDVSASSPSQVELTPNWSDELCPGAAWPMIWSGAGDYKIMAVIFGAVPEDLAASTPPAILMPFISLPQQ